MYRLGGWSVCEGVGSVKVMVNLWLQVVSYQKQLPSTSCRITIELSQHRYSMCVDTVYTVQGLMSSCNAEV